MSDYWESKKSIPTVKKWLMEYEGSMVCACDHGCNQWIKENQTKAWLLIKVLTDSKAATNPDKIVNMHTDRIDKIWRRLQAWRTERFNRWLRENRTIKEMENYFD